MLIFKILIANLFASTPHTMFVNGQPMKEWAPIVYELEARTLVINDFACDPWMPVLNKKIDQDKAVISSLPAIYFTKTGRFYLVNQLYYYPETKTWIVNTFDHIQCNQITIFKDSYE